MELDSINILLEKYFKGATTIAEENQLKIYFASSDVAQHLQQYKSLFMFFSDAKEEKSAHELPLLPIHRNTKRNLTWLSIAASVVILIGVSTFNYVNYSSEVTGLGSYDDPEVAFKATQKALALLSNNVNVGVESVQYIQEYEKSKNLIFKKQFK